MRELVFDVETTGMSYENGDRIVEIGMVELINKTKTGRTLHMFFNPEKQMDDEVISVHHITNEFVADKPLFKEKAKEIFDFINTDSVLIAHNASFDMGFLNYELQNAGFDKIDESRFIDTLIISRTKYPQYRSHSLDAICKRFDISLTEREEKGHGALLDSYLLVDVYLEMTGKKEFDFSDNTSSKRGIQTNRKNLSEIYNNKNKILNLSVINPTEAEQENHKNFLSTFKSSPMWNSDNTTDNK